MLGDPIELQALANAYRGTERVPLAVASVKVTSDIWRPPPVSLR
ncbi:hypothetical protein ACPA9J_27380 [Pseudomonas aeruginosa]